METNNKVVWKPTIKLYSMETNNNKVVWKPTLKQYGNQQ